MKKRCCFRLFTLIAAIVQLASAQAATPDVTWYAERGNFLVQEYRKEIRPGLSAEVRDLESRIEYKVIRSPAVGAFALQQGGRAQIHILAGTLEVIDWMATATVIGQRSPGCFRAYYGHLAAGLRANTRQQRGVEKVHTPFAFASSNPGTCPRIRSSDLVGTEADDIREEFIAINMKLIMAHEIGHHALKHRPVLNDSLEARRTRESAADAFALDTLIRNGDLAFMGYQVFLLFSEAEQNTPDEEKGATHPSAERRILALIEGTRKALDQENSLSRKLRNAGTLGPSRRFLSDMEASLALPLKEAGISLEPREDGGVANYCLPLKAIIAEAPSKFRALRTKRSPYDYQEWISRINLPGLDECTIDADGTMGCSSPLFHDEDAAISSYERHQKSVEGCLQSWSVAKPLNMKFYARDYRLKSSHGMVSVTLVTTSRSYMISISVYGPDD